MRCGETLARKLVAAWNPHLEPGHWAFETLVEDCKDRTEPPPKDTVELIILLAEGNEHARAYQR